jgi:hypothetical protein
MIKRVGASRCEAHPVAATVHEAKWRPQRNRCFEATSVRTLNAQSPSELQWRLRVKSRRIYGFDNMMDLEHTIWHHGQSLLPATPLATPFAATPRRSQIPPICERPLI